MTQMDRRKFLRSTVGISTGVVLGGKINVGWGATVRRAEDVVYLGPDKIRLSRLAMGTGTFGGNLQRQLGLEGLASYLEFGTERGIIFWEAADA